MNDKNVTAEVSGRHRKPTDRRWKILVVDDDADVHLVTRMVLSNAVVAGKKLNLIDEYSAKGAIDCLNSTDDIDLVLLDVVMETNDAGLEVARWLREDAGRINTPVIVLRTGQPGYLNLQDVTKNNYVDAVLDKCQITHASLVSILTKMLPRDETAE